MKRNPEFDKACRRYQYGKNKAYKILDEELKRLHKKFNSDIDKIDLSDGD